MPTSVWNSLEVVKLAVGLLTPIFIALGGIYIHRVTKRFEHVQWRSQKLVEKRLQIYDLLAPQLNDLLCYFTYVGNWREVDPITIIGLKRKIDKEVYLAGPLFSPEFFSACMAYQSLCFETYTGWGNDAKLRTQYVRRKQGMAEKWRAEWESLFSEAPSDPKAIRDAYQNVMSIFAADIGVNQMVVLPKPGRVPSNVS